MLTLDGVMELILERDNNCVPYVSLLEVLSECLYVCVLVMKVTVPRFNKKLNFSSPPSHLARRYYRCDASTSTYVPRGNFCHERHF